MIKNVMYGSPDKKQGVRGYGYVFYYLLPTCSGPRPYEQRAFSCEKNAIGIIGDSFVPAASGGAESPERW